VGVITDEDIEEVFGIRSVLEGYAAALATQKITPEVVNTLKGIVRKQEACLRNNEIDAVIQLNTEFHETLYRAAKSAKLFTIINDLKDYIYRYRIIILRHEGHAEIAIQDHKDMISAMEQKNARVVEKLVRKHIVRGKDLVKRRIRQESKRKMRKE
jgi:Transcriptional regulators